MPNRVIERAEVTALLFNVSDIAVTLANIERLLGGEDDGEEEDDQGGTRRDERPPCSSSGERPTDA
jgi:hypothetical protein